MTEEQNRRKSDKFKSALLIVEKDRDQIDEILNALEEASSALNIITTDSISGAETILKGNSHIDLLIIDFQLSEKQLSESFLLELRRLNSQISVIVYTDFDLSVDQEIELKKLGVQDIIEKSKGSELLLASVDNVLANRFLMYYDNMTHTLAKLMFDPTLRKEMNKVNKEKNYNMTMVNIDYKNFKHINDNYGHQTGDDVLILSSKIIRENLRDADLIFRVGGDEFYILMPQTNTHDAVNIMQRICNKIKTSEEIKAATGIEVSINVGIVETFKGHKEELVRSRSEIAMYKAKNEEKDIVFYSHKQEDYIADDDVEAIKKEESE